MVRVIVEFVPLGDESRRETLGIAEIWNNETGSDVLGNYHYTLTRHGQRTGSGTVRVFPRLTLDLWGLLYCVLENAIGKGIQQKGNTK